MSKAQRIVIVQNDELKQSLQKKESIVGKITNIQDKIKTLEEKRTKLLPSKERIEKKIIRLAGDVKIDVKEGEEVQQVAVVDGKVEFTVTNKELFIRELTEQQIEKLREQCEIEIKKLNEKDGDK